MSDDEIRKLRKAAVKARDTRTIVLCDLALYAPDDDSTSETPCTKPKSSPTP
jgi:hypothetical protein